MSRATYPNSPNQAARPEAQSAARKAAAFDAGPDCTLVTDQEGKILEVNRAGESVLGYRCEQLLGRELMETLLPEAYRARPREHLRGHGVSGAQAFPERRMELIVLRADGRTFPAELSLTHIRLEGGSLFNFVLRDISARQRATTASRALAGNLTALVESSDDAIIGKDLDGIITSWNKGAERLYGYTPEEVIGQPVSLLMPPERADDFPGIMGKLRQGEKIDHYETLRRAKDGRILTVSLSVSAIKDDTGKVLGASAIARDITRQKEEEKIRAQMQELLLESQRVREASRLKSEFLANMSHELRTPLNGIIGFAEFMADQKPGRLNDKQREYLGDILSSAHHLLHLINDILDLSKVEAGRMRFYPENFSVDEAATEVCRMLVPLAEKKQLHLHTAITLEPPAVRLDPQKFKQVLYNLLSNAVKFTKPGGRIDVQLGPAGPDRFELVVRDTGIGISPTDQKKLFIEFYQIDTTLGRAHGGTGLGLALCKRIVELQGGTISLESEPGKGSAFTVVFPRQHPESGGTGPRSVPSI